MTIDVTTSAICIESTGGRFASFPLGSMIVRRESDTEVHIDSIYTNDLYKETISDINLLMIKNTDTVAPTAGDDNTGGYIIGDIWHDSVGDVYYKATSVGTGTATWVALSGVTEVVKDYTRKLVEHMSGTAGIF